MSVLPPHEQNFVDFMASPSNVLGWRAEGRDEHGRAVVRADVEGPGGAAQVYRMTLAPEGHIHHAPALRVLPTRTARRERESVATSELQSSDLMRCPNDGAPLVEDRGWLRCPTPKCTPKGAVVVR